MPAIRTEFDRNKRLNEAQALSALKDIAALDGAQRAAIVTRATQLVSDIRDASRPGLMDVFLAEYGLSTEEGVALMCLAEALLRVPDSTTIDALIEDKIAPSDWSKHVGHSSSPLVNASTWGLLLTGKVLDEDTSGLVGQLRGAIKRVGEPVIRAAVGRAMREMGRQFVLGQDIGAAMERASKKEAEGFTYSYDMLGEAAMTAQDASRYAKSYADAIDAIAKNCKSDDIGTNPGISVKFSALHPRYEVAKTERVMAELVPVVRDLARKAAKARMGFNVDAEEADRLALSLEVIEAVMADPELDGWDGFGIVVQAYGRRAPQTLDTLYEMAQRYNRRIMVRLVKGAYWDTEIKHAQVEGLEDFPVFTRKVATDVSYIANARKLLNMTDRIYPQFATHNAHTVCAVLEMAKDQPTEAYEFQRLHGMGEALHNIVHKDQGTRCRIYAPVGAHRDLLAYLVRRLLENGANSSFVNQIVNEQVPASEVAACPFDKLEQERDAFEPLLTYGPDLFQPERKNSEGFDLFDVTELARIEAVRARPEPWRVEPILAVAYEGEAPVTATNPATGDLIGEVVTVTPTDIDAALDAAQPWAVSQEERAFILNRAADLYEEGFGEIFSLLGTEAGKSLPDAVAELREAVDFLRYYAAQSASRNAPARGLFTCISPWNFPLAIFTGQIAAALATGNGVLAKPAETTPAIAAWGVNLLHKAGVPKSALQLLPGEGRIVGTALTSDPRINGVAFTGSTATARRIQRTMAENLEPGTPLIAETGGLNAMIVDSTALPEQAVRDIVASAFQSAGQRCSALRCLYVQKDIEPQIREMLIGAMNELTQGDPWHLSTDVGPVITHAAKTEIADYVAKAENQGRLIHRLKSPATGTFYDPAKGHYVAPSLLKVDGITDLEKEVFGPVLHLATFKAKDIDKVVEAINATGYGLTFGLHTRIDSRVQEISDRVHAGNIYVNRNQIGAIVGSQPFGGEGLSGTGPKAGGPNYLSRFVRQDTAKANGTDVKTVSGAELEKLVSEAIENGPQRRLRDRLMPGPTGELNRLGFEAREPVLCLGPTDSARAAQADAIEALGGVAVPVKGILAPEVLREVSHIGAVLWWGEADTARAYAKALADRDGPIVALVTGQPDAGHAVHERHLCVDTTAAGGNASLLAGADS